MDAVSVHSGEYVEFFNQLALDRVANLVPRMSVRDEDKIADFGCGNGMLLKALGPRSGTYDGIDFSQDFISAANERATGQNFKFHCRDIVDFCADHLEEFDVATTLDFSEHIDDQTFLRIYPAIRSSLKPNGGKLFLHTPNGDFFMERLKSAGVVKQLRGHIAIRNARQIEYLLKKSGFSGVKIQVIPHYNILKIVHPLSGIGLFAARLWIEAKP